MLNDLSGRLSNYTVASTNGTLTITPATLTVTAIDQIKAFGDALPELSASYSGFVLGENTNGLTTLASLATTATATSDVGTYPITVEGASSSNYMFSYFGGTLTITQALTVGTITSSTNPVPAGANVTFTMNVSATAHKTRGR